MNILFLKKFNNYANRIVVKYSTLEEYQQRAASFITFSDINFNPNDGVMTELIVGNETQQQPVSSNTTTVLDWETNGSPDYLVCFTASGTTNTIVSRWFITECVRTRLGQFKLQLKRDSIADHLTSVEDATCFINKGYIESKEDSAIFNKENITTNQIKSDEFLLKDETQCPWIVGYVAKNKLDGTTVTFEDTSIYGPEATDSAASEVYANESAFLQAHQDITGELATLNNWKVSVKLDVYYLRLAFTYKVGQTVTLNNLNNVSWQESAYENDQYLHSIYQEGQTTIWKAWAGDFREKLANNLVANWKSSSFKEGTKAQIAAKEGVTIKTNEEMQAFFSYIKSRPIIKIGSDFYRPYDIYANNSTKTDSQYITLGSTMYNLMLDNLDRTPENNPDQARDIEGEPGPTTFNIEYSIDKHALGLQKLHSECKAKVPVTAPLLKDAPYYMFAIPYSDDLAIYSGNTLHCTSSKSVAMNAGISICEKAGSGAVYDVQLLPYCPIRDAIKTEHKSNYVITPPATYDYVIGSTEQFGITRYYKQDIVKLNHQYIISKDLTFSSGTRFYGISSESPIKVKIGTSNLENQLTPTEDYYRIEVRYSDISDDTSAVKIFLYRSSIHIPGETPVEIDYTTYCAGNQLVGVYFTDVCKYGVIRAVFPGPSWTITYQTLPTSRLAYTLSYKMFNDYVYYKDYYTSKVDTSTVSTSDIVTVVDGVEADTVSTIFWAKESQFTFDRFMAPYLLLQSDGSYKANIMSEVTREAISLGSNVADIKVKNQTEMIRLASPNYSNFFDINAQMNKGISYFNIDCTYKPYSPYIHVNPDFGGLYGADYNDIRGLICGGDFSVALTNDAWSTYQLQNKNYQAVFDRQMQQLETQQGIQREMNIINAVTGTASAGVGGAVTGALTGAKVGGPYGAIAGAAIGGIAGTAGGVIGGVADIYNADRIMELQRSTMKDIHNLQLDNIKALPIGLSKTSYLTNNNKIFPFIEVYKATPIEEMAMRDLIDYNGMTINRIGKIRDFQSDKQLPYIKAQLIRIDIQDDPHQVTAISSELATGVYLPEGDSDLPPDDSSDSEE